MKKQYRYGDLLSFGKKYLNLYHNGELVETKKLWIDEFWDEKDKLEEVGYTYGFTKAEIEEAKQRYEYMLENILEVKK